MDLPMIENAGRAVKGTRGFICVPVFERFWSSVRKTGTCWLWTASTDARGYGQLYCDGRRQKAHRVSLILLGIEIPEGAMVCHHCDNPTCVRPSHLFIGSQSENMVDCARKGRHHYTRRTACALGHPLTGDNVVRRGRGRECRACKRASTRDYMRRKRAALLTGPWKGIGA
jgi:hypothetical protein